MSLPQNDPVSSRDACSSEKIKQIIKTIFMCFVLIFIQYEEYLYLELRVGCWATLSDAQSSGLRSDPWRCLGDQLDGPVEASPFSPVLSPARERLLLGIRFPHFFRRLFFP